MTRRTWLLFAFVLACCVSLHYSSCEELVNNNNNASLLSTDNTNNNTKSNSDKIIPYDVSNKTVLSEKKKNKVFLLVLDGFVHDYQQLGVSMPNLQTVCQNGVHAERMIPVFPSDTWPTMTSLNTGLYTETHGIIKNTIFNPKLNLTFDLLDPNLVDHYAPFFTKEPLWLTNQKQGGRFFIWIWFVKFYLG